jgi:L-fuculokinase
MKQCVILIFDIGKTNKKFYLLDENFNEIEKEYVQFAEIADGDGFFCDDLPAISKWVIEVHNRFTTHTKYDVKFVNFSTYGATFVHLDKDGKLCTPLYNYLKEYPTDVKEYFMSLYGDINTWSKETASPYLGMLNAGLQLFWLKYKKPEIFKTIKTSIFLPQYFSYLLTGKLTSEYTSIGCHTGLWNFKTHSYHHWVLKEGFDVLFPPIVSSSLHINLHHTTTSFGVGIHDSSAALIPYKRKNTQPFMLLSTGTWSICLNPFNNQPLTEAELAQDCLCYLQPDSKQVKASRYFLGNEFSGWVKLLDSFFNKASDYHHKIVFDKSLYQQSQKIRSPLFVNNKEAANTYFDNNSSFDLSYFNTYEEAYHHLIAELVVVQVDKIHLALGKSDVKKIYIDGGFSANDVFLKTLQHSLPGIAFIPSEIPLGSSLGAAMVVSNDDRKLKKVSQRL